MKRILHCAGRRAKVALLYLGIGLTAASVAPPEAYGQSNRIRMQSAVPASAVEFKILQNFAQRIDKMTNGRLKIDVLPDGAVVGAFEILDAVDKGLVESGYAWSHYWSGKDPAGLLFGAPPAGAGVGLDQLAYLSWYLAGGGKQLHKEWFDEHLKVNVVTFIMEGNGPEALGWFKEPFRNMDDLRTRRFRVPPGIPAAIYKELGVPAIALAGAEIIPAAERGVLDAAEWSSPVTDLAYGFQRAFKYYYLQGLHQSISNSDVYINKNVWNRLPKDVQAIVEGAALATITESFMYRINANAIALAELKTKHGVHVMETPADYVPAFMGATKKVLGELASKNAFFKKVFDSQSAFAKQVVPYWSTIQKLNSSVGEAYVKGGTR